MKRIFALLFVLLFSMATLPAASKPLTAFEAKEIAQKAVPAKRKAQLIAIEGRRSETELTPDTWRFVFFDEQARQQGRAVTVTRGSVTEMREGYIDLNKFRLAAYKEDEVITESRLKCDSSKALDLVRKDLRLQDVQLSSVLFQLQLDPDRDLPVWTLTLLADDTKGYETDIGKVKVDAEHGVVIETKISLDKIKKK